MVQQANIKERILFLFREDFNLFNRLRSENLLGEVEEMTSFLDEVYPNISYSQRFWHIKNKKYIIEKCICGELAKFNDRKAKYVSCSQECSRKKMKETTKERYGEENYSSTEKYKEKNRDRLKKFKETCAIKYGVDNPSKSDEIKKKLSEANSLRDNDEIIAKIKETNLQRHGVENVSQLVEVRKKIGESTKKLMEDIDHRKNLENIFINRHGINNPAKSDEIKKKISISVSNPENQKIRKKKYKETSIRKYGTDHPSKSKIVREKISKIKKDKFTKRLPDDISLISFNDPIQMHHNKCNKNFEIYRSLFFFRERSGHQICTECNPITKEWSSAEKEVLDFVASIYDKDIIENAMVHSKDIDIYLPLEKLAIEYNGIYWHSELHKSKYHHANKSSALHDNGIQLLHIWEDDWLYRQEIVKSIISGYLGRHKRIFARKCKIIKLQFKDCKDFVKNCHLQGIVPATLYYGLFYEGELVQIMSFKKISNYWEISRLCSKLNTQIVGGASKLFKKFLIDNNPDKVITYCNMDYFSGDSYEKLGMNFVGKTSPSYWYINLNSSTKVRLARNKFQKHKIGMGSKKTEAEIMNEKKFIRIYNSGNKKFEYKS